MSFWIILIIIHLGSLLFCLASLWQLWKYIRVYHFPLEHYELLFGFIHLRGIGVAYVVVLLAWIAYSTLFIISYW